MILEATANDFASILRGEAPRDLCLVSDSAIAPLEVLQMLSDLASRVRSKFAPSAWMMVEDGELVGLCSIERMPSDGEIHLGYGVAPTKQGQGVARRAIKEIVNWAKSDPRVTRLSAETNVNNLPSQRVLERNGFVTVGTRTDDEDGELICWQIFTVSR
jgi:RimJ/RimL family protein N-acetyltransferase